MDLKALGEINETATLELRHPVTDEVVTDDGGKAMTITVHGVDSPVYRKAMHEHQNRRIEKAQRVGKTKVTAEQLESSALDVLAKCTDSWNIVLDGDTPKCTAENARSLYTDYPWIREQVDAFMEDRRNFLGS